MKRSVLYPMGALLIVGSVIVSTLLTLYSETTYTHKKVEAPILEFVKEYYNFLIKVGPETNYFLDTLAYNELLSSLKSLFENLPANEFSKEYFRDHILESLNNQLEQDTIKYSDFIRSGTDYDVVISDAKWKYASNLYTLEIYFDEIHYEKSSDILRNKIEHTFTAKIMTERGEVPARFAVRRRYNFDYIYESLKESGINNFFKKDASNNYIEYIAMYCVNKLENTDGIEGCKFEYKNEWINDTITVIDVKENSVKLNNSVILLNNGKVLYFPNIVLPIKFNVIKTINVNICEELDEELKTANVDCQFDPNIDDCVCVVKKWDEVIQYDHPTCIANSDFEFCEEGDLYFCADADGDGQKDDLVVDYESGCTPHRP